MIRLNDLPTIVKGPGEYVTRNGDRVTVHTVTEPAAEGTTASRVKGSVWRMFRGKYRPRGYNIWHVSGRRFILREDGKDIVGPWEGGR